MARRTAKVFPFFTKSVVFFLSFLYGTFFSLALGYSSELTWTFSTSVGYDEGKFGTSSKTSTLYVPVSLRAGWGEIGDLEGTIAYVRQTSPAGTTIIGGVPIRIGGAGAVRTVDGFGDVNLRARYFAIKEGDSYPGLFPFVSIKFPTAESGTLGTGKFDYEAGLELLKSFGPIVAFVNGSYTWIGEPAAQRLEDRKGYGAGISWNATESFSVTGSINGSNALAKAQDDPLAITLGLSYNFTQSFGVNISGTKGLSDGSPNFGVTTGITYTFSP